MRHPAITDCPELVLRDQAERPSCAARRWTGKALPLRFPCLLFDHFWEDFRCYPHGELRLKEETDSGTGIQLELRDLDYCARLSWMDGCAPRPLGSGLSDSLEDLDRVEFGWRLWVGFGLNLGVWTPFSSPGLSSWENNFFLYLAIKWTLPH